jgi:HlyD family secretion protein
MELPMPETTPKKKSFKWLIIVLVAVALAGFLGYKYWESQRFALPDGIASGNGRLEAKLVDVSAKESLRVKEILVNEGDLVQPGQVVVQMDTSTLNSELNEAKAKVELAKIEVERTRKLLEERAGSQRDYDTRKTALETNVANVATIQTRIDDATLKAPVRGRVLYRLTEVGEVLAPGGKALTLINLEDVYMEIYLPSEQAARLRAGDSKTGSEARITLDYAPGRAAAGYVTFVSPEAQFTPKQVETRSERDKLMFRVKIQVPEELVAAYIERIKTGVRGVGYVKYKDSAVWPSWLQNLITPPAKTDAKPTEPTAAPAPAAEPK